MIQHTEISLEKKAVRHNGGNNERHSQTDWSLVWLRFLLILMEVMSGRKTE